MDVVVCGLSNLDSSQMPAINGYKVEESFSAKKKSLISTHLADLVENFDRYTLNEIRKSKNKADLDGYSKFSVDCFVFSYDREHATAEIVYRPIQKSLDQSSTNQFLVVRFSSFIELLSTLSGRIHSDGNRYCDSVDQKLVDFIKGSLVSLQKISKSNHSVRVQVKNELSTQDNPAEQLDDDRSASFDFDSTVTIPKPYKEIDKSIKTIESARILELRPESLEIVVKSIVEKGKKTRLRFSAPYQYDEFIKSYPEALLHSPCLIDYEYQGNELGFFVILTHRKSDYSAFSELGI